MAMSETMRGCVARGAALLDEVRPGWEWAVSLSDLDLSDCSECALGQLYGSFTTGLCEVMPDGTGFTDDWRYGFNEPPGSQRRLVRLGWTYRALTAAWGSEVRSRRIARPASAVELIGESISEPAGVLCP